MALPDNERIMSEVQSLAEQARDNLQVPRQNPGEAGGAPVTRVAPIYMGKAHEIIPDRYVVHYHISQCANCGTESRYNEFFALSYIRSRINGTRVRHLTRCDSAMYNLPVDIIPTGTRRTPFCCECETIDLSHLPPPPEPSRLTELPEPKSRGWGTRQTKKEKTTKAEAKPASLDDLI